MTKLNDSPEVWTDINGFENLYRISSYGNVVSCAKKWEANGKPFSKDETVLKQFKNKWGYPMATLQKDGFARNCSVHRLVAIAFIPNPENKPQVNHKDGDKTNNNKDNLEWATRCENMRHSWEMGLHKSYDMPKGANSPRAKLTEVQAEEIRNSPKSSRTLAKIYGVNSSSICLIKKGVRYPKQKTA